ncbi:MAG: hypothetical protein AAGI01_10610, partial [Myxococcota bacterium]
PEEVFNPSTNDNETRRVRGRKGFGAVIASFDGEFFSFGLGGGALRGRAPAGASAEAASPRLIGALSQSARLGAVDGLHVEVINHFAVSPEAIEFEAVLLRTQARVTEGTWLFINGGGGGDFGFFDGGIRQLLKGRGRSESVFLRLQMGFVSAPDDGGVRAVRGLTFGAGVEARLGGGR